LSIPVRAGLHVAEELLRAGGARAGVRGRLYSPPGPLQNSTTAPTHRAC